MHPPHMTTLDRRSHAREMRRMFSRFILECVFGGVMTNLVSGVFLIKLALEWGASPFHIGLLASLPFLGQLLQVPSVMLVGIFGTRKVFSCLGSLVHRLAIAGMAVVPWIGDPAKAMMWLIVLIAVREMGLGWAAGAWYGWMRDLVPPQLTGRLFGRRLNVFTLAGTLAALAGGLLLDRMEALNQGWVLPTLSAYFALAALCGVVSLWIWVTTPDAPLERASARSMLQQLWEPLTDANFRRINALLLALLFAVNIAVPFFPAFMLKTMGMPAGYVIGIWAFGQLMQVPFFTWWGWVADKFSYTTALAACLPFFVVGMVLWPFVTLPEQHLLSLPLLILIHALIGIGLAGVLLTAQVFAMKLAPASKVTGYVATTAMLSSVAAGIASIVGGLIAEQLYESRLSLSLVWQGAETHGELVAYALSGYEFLFLISAVLVLLASPLLAGIREPGKVPRQVVMRLMQEKAVGMFRTGGTVPGLRYLIQFPLALLMKK